MCRSHTCWVFLDLGDFATYWVPVSKLQHWTVWLSGVHQELLVGSSCNTVCCVPVCRTTGCSICVLSVLCHIRSASLDLLSLQKMALLSPGESNTVSHFYVLEMHPVSKMSLNFVQFIRLSVLVSLFEGSIQSIAVKWNGLVAHVSMISEQYCYMALGQLIAVAWYMYRTIVTCLFFFLWKYKKASVSC